jgi:hypothetical protein
MLKWSPFVAPFSDEVVLFFLQHDVYFRVETYTPVGRPPSIIEPVMGILGDDRLTVTVRCA